MMALAKIYFRDGSTVELGPNKDTDVKGYDVEGGCLIIYLAPPNSKIMGWPLDLIDNWEYWPSTPRGSF